MVLYSHLCWCVRKQSHNQSTNFLISNDDDDDDYDYDTVYNNDEGDGDGNNKWL